MRRYRIEYYAERNDECVDLDCVVEANTILDALQEFDKECKRITTITELPYGE